MLSYSTKVVSIAPKVAQEKKSSKHVHIGSSFEELVAINAMVKADLNSDARIKSYGFLNFSKPQINVRGLLDDVA